MLPDTAYYFHPFSVGEWRLARDEITQFLDLPPIVSVTQF
ncbi:hypothetical protein NIES4074_09090 [Cylindrospermum sp. NIES-4074]|jgi:hypothetical protein|nr:hypothetical protein NIES4074_09090 [Cylindrospermum sp. NIES-4074]